MDRPDHNILPETESPTRLCQFESVHTHASPTMCSSVVDTGHRHSHLNRSVCSIVKRCSVYRKRSELLESRDSPTENPGPSMSCLTRANRT